MKVFAATSGSMDGLERAKLRENSQGDASWGSCWRTLSAQCCIRGPEP